MADPAGGGRRPGRRGRRLAGVPPAAHADPRGPRLAGRQVSELELVAQQFDWTLDQKKTRQDGTEPGEIVETTPEAGSQLKEGGTLTVLVSEGNELTDRPKNLAGRPLAEVQVDLQRAGLKSSVKKVFDEEVPADHVIGTDGQIDAQLPKGEVVPLLVSKGPAPRTVPEVPAEGGYDAYAAELQKQSLVPVRVNVFSDDVDKGGIIAVEPAPGTEVPRDSKVEVRVSKGPDLVVVPDLGGLHLDEAEAALKKAGLVLGQACCSPRGRVVGSDPAAGSYVRRGSSVNLFMAR